MTAERRRRAVMAAAQFAEEIRRAGGLLSQHMLAMSVAEFIAEVCAPNSLELRYAPTALQAAESPPLRTAQPVWEDLSEILTTGVETDFQSAAAATRPQRDADELRFNRNFDAVARREQGEPQPAPDVAERRPMDSPEAATPEAAGIELEQRPLDTPPAARHFIDLRPMRRIELPGTAARDIAPQDAPAEPAGAFGLSPQLSWLRSNRRVPRAQCCDQLAQYILSALPVVAHSQSGRAITRMMLFDALFAAGVRLNEYGVLGLLTMPDSADTAYSANTACLWLTRINGPYASRVQAAGPDDRRGAGALLSTVARGWRQPHATPPGALRAALARFSNGPAATAITDALLELHAHPLIILTAAARGGVWRQILTAPGFEARLRTLRDYQTLESWQAPLLTAMRSWPNVSRRSWWLAALSDASNATRRQARST